MFSLIRNMLAKRREAAKHREMQRHKQRAADKRDSDYQRLWDSYQKVLEQNKAAVKAFQAQKTEAERLQQIVASKSNQLEAAINRNSQHESHIADLKISLEHSKHERSKLTQDLELANRLNRQLAEIIERDRQRVIAEKNAYIALGEKSLGQ